MSQIQFKKLFKLLEEIIGETFDYIGRTPTINKKEKKNLAYWATLHLILRIIFHRAIRVQKSTGLENLSLTLGQCKDSSDFYKILMRKTGKYFSHFTDE